MDDDHVTLNAGGRVFETTALTLKTCGAGYFEALLGETGARLPGSKKRARVSEDGDDAPCRREIFIDRDPDVFADVLRYMRTSRLPAAAAADVHRLADLKLEAEFLAYDALLNACDAAEILGHPEEFAQSKMFYVAPNASQIDDWGEEKIISVPEGQVLFISQVTPVITNSSMSEWRLRADAKGEMAVIAQYHVKAPGTKGDATHKFLQRDMNIVLDGGENEEVRFDAIGTGWDVICWIGHPSKIPGLAPPRA
jgi:hypothetical protein